MHQFSPPFPLSVVLAETSKFLKLSEGKELFTQLKGVLAGGQGGLKMYIDQYPRGVCYMVKDHSGGKIPGGSGLICPGDLTQQVQGSCSS